ncbi:hypothetical protein Tco_0881862 [Tanacetum coccineum]
MENQSELHGLKEDYLGQGKHNIASKDEGKMGTYVENLKKLLDDVKANMPNPPSRDTGDLIEAESLVSTEESLVILHMILYESYEI